MNRFGYVEGNPLHFIDPTGYAAVEQALAECTANGWRCDDLTHDMAVEILNGNAIDIDWSDPSALSNGSPIDKLLFVASMASGSGEEGIAAKGLFKQLERQLAKDGPQSIRKSLSSITKQLEEHRVKLPNIEFKSSVEREIRSFEEQIRAIQQFMKEKGIE